MYWLTIPPRNSSSPYRCVDGDDDGRVVVGRVLIEALVWSVVVEVALVNAEHGTGVTLMKSVASSPDAWVCRKVRQLVSTSRGAGPILAAARMRRMVPAPTRWPSPTSSPWMRRGLA